VKLKEILLFMLVIVFTLGALSSCVTSATEITVNLTIKAGDDKIFNGKVKVNSESPTVISAISEAIATNGLNITLDPNGNSVTKVNNYNETVIDGISYYWMYTINAVEPTTGKASSNAIKDGDAIEYIFYSSDPGDNPPSTLKSQPYKSEWELFGEGDSSSTTDGLTEAVSGETTAG
jgi:hypothetical protein